MSKGILQVHPPICDCPGCRISSPVNRGRLADKRTVALPTARVLKKELTTSFSATDGDSDGNGPAYGQRPGLKQEDTPHVRIMKRRVHTHWDVNISFRETSCSQDSDLPTLISSVHRSRHLVMPEHQSRCEFQRGGVEIGLGAAGDLLGKRPGRTPHVSSECPLEKKARSKPPQETLLLPELGPSMAPEDHYRRLVSALSEAGTFEDPQRLYHLGLPSHGFGLPCPVAFCSSFCPHDQTARSTWSPWCPWPVSYVPQPWGSLASRPPLTIPTHPNPPRSPEGPARGGSSICEEPQWPGSPLTLIHGRSAPKAGPGSAPRGHRASWHPILLREVLGAHIRKGPIFSSLASQIHLAPGFCRSRPQPASALNRAHTLLPRHSHTQPCWYRKCARQCAGPRFMV
uniref:Sterile alpha motif domain containing 11 n=1 Tax=Panthera tigris altaica TaxID=74533 RepID=A0A8C9M9D3_PANTA